MYIAYFISSSLDNPVFFQKFTNFLNLTYLSTPLQMARFFLLDMNNFIIIQTNYFIELRFRWS